MKKDLDTFVQPVIPPQNISSATGYPKVDAAFRAALDALQSNPLEALSDYPYPARAQPALKAFLGTSTKDLSAQGAAVQPVIRKILTNAYEAAALQGPQNAEVAFQALALRFQRKVKSVHGKAIVNYKEASHTLQIMKKIVQKYPWAVEKALQTAHAQREAFKDSIAEEAAAMKWNGEVDGPVDIRHPKLVLPEEIVAFLKKLRTKTTAALASEDPTVLIPALKIYPPGGRMEAEFAAYKDAALRSVINAQIVLEVLARRWNKKPEAEKNDPFYREGSHSYQTMVAIANKRGEGVTVDPGAGDGLDFQRVVVEFDKKNPNILPKEITRTAQMWIEGHEHVADLAIAPPVAPAMPASEMPAPKQKSTRIMDKLPTASVLAEKFLIGGVNIHGIKDEDFAPTQFPDSGGHSEQQQQGWVDRAGTSPRQQGDDWVNTLQPDDASPDHKGQSR